MKKSHANGIGIRLTGIGSLATVVVKEVEDISAFMLEMHVARLLVAAIHCRVCGKAIVDYISQKDLKLYSHSESQSLHFAHAQLSSYCELYS